MQNDLAAFTAVASALVAIAQERHNMHEALIGDEAASAVVGQAQQQARL